MVACVRASYIKNLGWDIIGVFSCGSWGFCGWCHWCGGGGFLTVVKIVLGMTGDLASSSCGDKVFRDAFPVTLTQRFNPFKKPPVLLLTPWHTYLPISSTHKKNMRLIQVRHFHIYAISHSTINLYIYLRTKQRQYCQQQQFEISQLYS